jgi:hypothetical protein
MNRTERILNEEEIRKNEILQLGLRRKLCYFFVFNNTVTFRDFWAPRMKKKFYKTRFYQYAPALSNDLTWGGARTIGKSDDLVFSLINIALRFKNKKTLLTAFRKIHVKDRLEDLISSLVNEPYLRKFFHGDADKSLRDSVVRTPIYHIKFKNGHEIKGISVGDDPAAVMIQGEHPNFRMIEECVPGGTLVTLENGQQKPIKEIVENKEKCSVLSWNGEELESKKVVNFFEREVKELLEFSVIKSQDGKREYFKFRCTPDHKILTPDGYIRACDLDEKNEIFLLVDKIQRERRLWSKIEDIKLKNLVSERRGYPEISKIMNRSLSSIRRRGMRLGLKIGDWKKIEILTSFQKEMLYGTLLGDGSLSISKGCCLPRFRCCHSIQQRLYLEHKFSILKNICSSLPYVSNNKKGWGQPVVSFNTLTHPELLEIYHFSHRNEKKTITKDWLDKLTPVSLAYFFQDDGSTTSHFGIQIASYGFSENENNLLSTFLLQRFGFKNKVHILEKKYRNLNRRYSFIRFEADSGRKFLKLIQPFIHESMSYKLGPVLNCPLCGSKFEYGTLKKYEEVI